MGGVTVRDVDVSCTLRAFLEQERQSELVTLGPETLCERGGDGRMRAYLRWEQDGRNSALEIYNTKNLCWAQAGYGAKDCTGLATEGYAI